MLVSETQYPLPNIEQEENNVVKLPDEFLQIPIFVPDYINSRQP